MADGNIKIKLAVDRARNRVLFADAGSDFVDVLLSFLTLPLSAVRLVAGASSPGCLSTLCQGVSCLRENKLLKFDACHGMLLRPRHEDEFGGIRCLRHGGYSCGCYYLTVKSDRSLSWPGAGWDCMCWLVIARVAHAFHRKEGAEMFVDRKWRFVISDDLVIKPASTANTLLLLQRINTGGGTLDHGFEEIEVCIGWTEVVSLLKASFSSKTVFTDTFLSKSKKETEVRATANLSIGQSIQHAQSRKETDDSLQFSIKVFYDRHEKKVMYAECDAEFVDLLLSFLVYPVACVIKNVAGTFSHIGCSLDNLYGSAVQLQADSFIAQNALENQRQTLLDPSISPFIIFRGSDSGVKRWFCLCRVPYCPCFRPSDCTCSRFVNDGKYVVDDDLLIYQASAVRVMKHWFNREKENVLEMDITISKQEAVDLLRATLTSKTALTDVFKSKLEGKMCQLSPWLQQNPSQIFVKLHTGKTITLDVENHDTIATVKQKISEKEGLQLPAGHLSHQAYGSRFSDWSTVADCKIGKESTIRFA